MISDLKEYMQNTISRSAIFAWIIIVQIAIFAVFESNLVDRYHGKQAKEDFAAVYAKIDALSIECNKLKKEEHNGNN